MKFDKRPRYPVPEMSDRQRLINLSARLQAARTELQKTPRYIVYICRNCGASSSFSWNFQINEPTKTCFECGFVEIVENKEAA